MLAPAPPTLTADEFADDLRVVGLLDGRRIGSADDQHACARASVLLMEAELGELRWPVLLAAIRKLHYGGEPKETQRKITGELEGLTGAVKYGGLALMKWICSDPQRKARALARLRATLSAL